MPESDPTAAAAAATEAAEERHRLEKLCEARCKKFACAIQYCLERNQYQEKRCWKEVGIWNLCCDRLKEREGAKSRAEAEPDASSGDSGDG